MRIGGKQLAALFVCSLVTWSVGNGLIPLLPVVATRMGADAALAGYYLGFAYLALTLGALTAGWVSARFRRQKLPLILICCLSIPAAWLMGQTSTVVGLTAVTAALFFCGGTSLVLIGILTSLSAGEHERGKVFGLLGLTSGLGSLVGNLGFGWLAERWDYTTMFHAAAGLLGLGLVCSLFVDEKQKPTRDREKAETRAAPGLGRSFSLLFSACLLTSMAGFLVLLIRSIRMDDLGFRPFEISSTGAVGGLISVPFPFLMGWLSDRMGRKILILAGYLSTLAAVILLAVSTELWHFWLAIGLSCITTGANSIGNALINDLVPVRSLHKALSIFGAASWIGGVAGFAVAGVTLQSLGFVPTYLIGGSLVVVAVLLLLPIPSGSGQKGAVEPRLNR